MNLRPFYLRAAPTTTGVIERLSVRGLAAIIHTERFLSEDRLLCRNLQVHIHELMLSFDPVNRDGASQDS